MAIDVGDVYRLTYLNLGPDGAPINAGSVSLQIRLPDGTSQTIGPITPTGLGTYMYDYATTMAGRHLARWVATGVGAGTEPEAFDVRPDDPGYLFSLDDAKKAMNIPATATVDDDEIREFVEAVTQVLQDITGKTILPQTYIETKAAYGDYDLLLDHRPVLSLVSVEQLDGPIAWGVPTVITTDPEVGVLTAGVGVPFRGNLQVTYRAGYQVVPANYTLAGKIILEHLWRTQQQPAMGPRSPFSDESGDLVDTGRGYLIPNRAAQLLGVGRKNRVA